MNRMNGHIWAESTAGFGTTLSFILPIFCLQELIGPILVRRDRSIETLAVLEVEIDSIQSSGVRRKVPERVSQAVKERLQRCLLPDLDVLLPKLRSDVAGESFLVVAAANEIGAEVLVKRIQEQLEQCQELKQTGFTSNISYRLLEVGATEANTPIEILLRKVTTGIEGLINSEPAAKHHHV
jgi:hypothetical protein